MAGTFGAFSPFPLQFGGGTRRVEVIYAALNNARGNAYDTSTWTSPVAIENRAFARALAASWSSHARAANQFDPTRTTDMLPRWERIFEIFPLTSDTPSQRRTRLAFKWAAQGKSPTYQQIYDDLSTKMGGALVGIVHTSSSLGFSIYPGLNGQVTAITPTAGGSGYGSAPSVVISAPAPGGVTATATAILVGGIVTAVDVINPGSGYSSIYPATVTFGSGAATAVAVVNLNPYDLTGSTVAGVSWVDWSSAVGHIAIQVTQPAGMPYAVYQQALAEMSLYLDGALPGWNTFDANIGTGFLLDQTNLNLYALDS